MELFLPAEQGDYGERRVYKLDLVERDARECSERLERYLLHSAVASGDAIQAARDDYRNVSKDRQMLVALPKAWRQIVDDEDEMLLEIVADRVGSLCGFKPRPDMVARFLKESVVGRVRQPAPAGSTARAKHAAQPASHAAAAPALAAASIKPVGQPASLAPASKGIPTPVPAQRTVSASNGATGFSFRGQFHPARNAIDTLRQVFDLPILLDATFGERFAGLPKHGRSRRYLALDANGLYPGRSDLVRDCSTRLGSGWWMSTNHSKHTIGQIIAMACDVAGVAFGRDLVANLG